LIRVFLILILFVFTLVLPVADSYAQAGSADCLDFINPLGKDRDEVQIEGGVWMIFSKVPSLTRHSSKAIAVDSNINKLIETLTYLCETRSGVSLNELATYVSKKLGELGEKKFKSLHITLGKPEQEIEDWLVYTKIARINEKRVLELSRIKNSIRSASHVVSRYRMLFAEFRYQNRSRSLLSRTVSLGREINDLLISDPYIALALFEESQVPFWDIDENYGGS
jgi:hypothetical protein